MHLSFVNIFVGALAAALHAAHSILAAYSNKLSARMWESLGIYLQIRKFPCGLFFKTIQEVF